MDEENENESNGWNVAGSRRDAVMSPDSRSMSWDETPNTRIEIRKVDWKRRSSF
jgi:hypothetical protein